MRVLLMLLLLSTTLLARAEFAVVVDKNSSINTLSGEQVASIFLGKTNRFPNGDRAIPLELNNNVLREDFYKRLSGKSLIQLKSYWATLVFTGKGKPPKVIDNVEEAVERFPNLPGAITYISQDDITDTMKVVYLEQ